MPEIVQDGAKTELFDFLSLPWTMRIILSLDKPERSRFQDLVEGFTGLSPATLSNRLKKLHELGLIDRHQYQDNPVRLSYELTQDGVVVATKVENLRRTCQHLDA